MHQGGPWTWESLPATEPQAALVDGGAHPSGDTLWLPAGSLLQGVRGLTEGCRVPFSPLLKAGGFYSRYLTFLCY